MAKTKALISCAVTAQLICGVFVFAYENCWFSHAAAQIINLLFFSLSIVYWIIFFFFFFFFFFNTTDIRNLIKIGSLLHMKRDRIFNESAG